MRKIILPLVGLFSLYAPATSQRQSLDRGPSGLSCSESGAAASIGLATYGTMGLPQLEMRGAPLIGRKLQLEATGLAGASGALLIGHESAPHFLPTYAATLYPRGAFSALPFVLDADGNSPLLGSGRIFDTNFCGRSLVAQAFLFDSGAMGGVAFTKALRLCIGSGADGPLFPESTSYGLAGAPLEVTLGDLNADQLADLVTCNIDGTLSLLFNTGDGSLTSPQTLTAFDQPLVSVAIGDLNADGILDVAVVNTLNGGGAFDFGAVSVLLGLGDGSLAPVQTYVAGVSPVFVAIGDLNGDHIPDLAVANRDSVKFSSASPPTVSVLLGLGDGTFSGQNDFSVAPENNADALNVAISDLDGDGAADLLLSYFIGLSSGNISVLMGLGDGSFGSLQRFPTGGRPLSVGLGDFNGDQITDLAVANFNTDEVSFLYGLGDGSFDDPLPQASGRGPRGIAVGDLNQDLVPDVVVINVLSQELGVLLDQLLGESP